EDGIRDRTVTGVQTCALPISQRVALARALAAEPELLLLDEPLSALDAGTRLDVQAELKRHLAGFTGSCLLVTHDPVEALVLADQIGRASCRKECRAAWWGDVE